MPQGFYPLKSPAFEREYPLHKPNIHNPHADRGLGGRLLYTLRRGRVAYAQGYAHEQENSVTEWPNQNHAGQSFHGNAKLMNEWHHGDWEVRECEIDLVEQSGGVHGQARFSPSPYLFSSVHPFLSCWTGLPVGRVLHCLLQCLVCLFMCCSKLYCLFSILETLKVEE